VLAFSLSPRVRLVVLGVVLAALLAAPATWAAETLGYATNGTFPTGGPASASALGGGGPGGFGGRSFRGAGSGRFGSGAGGTSPGGAVGQLFAQPGSGGFAPPAGGGGFGPPQGARGFGGGGAFGGGDASLSAAVGYAKAHGGGTIGVSSQSTAASLILSSNANIAGIGGFSGRESSVSVAWLANEVRTGHLRWVVADAQGQGTRLPGDTRTGSQTAMSVVEKVCRKVTVTTTGGSKVTMYDCSGRASAILAASNNRG
jgi:hypothetical protein